MLSKWSVSSVYEAMVQGIYLAQNRLKTRIVIRMKRHNRRLYINVIYVKKYIFLKYGITGNCYVWSVAMYGVETLTFRKEHEGRKKHRSS